MQTSILTNSMPVSFGFRFAPRFKFHSVPSGHFELGIRFGYLLVQYIVRRRGNFGRDAEPVINPCWQRSLSILVYLTIMSIGKEPCLQSKETHILTCCAGASVPKLPVRLSSFSGATFFSLDKRSNATQDIQMYSRIHRLATVRWEIGNSGCSSMSTLSILWLRLMW